ncbi:hypothetical protein ID866_3017 [Astraeus odoratus]|nr:hypothetical protein ID866_3017 [Astraeus odoratus]
MVSTESDAVIHDEACPLLPHVHTEAQTTISSSTPLRKSQIMALCVARLVDPIAFTQLFPYVNDYMSYLRLTDDPSLIGFYSGLESAFGVAQLCAIYPCAKLSDVVGRRPVLLVSVLGTGIMSLVFGLSKSLAVILAVRCLGGLFAGNTAVVQSMLGESMDSTNQATVVPIFGLMWPLGSIIGPLIGGFFSQGAFKFPNLFGYGIFQENPYFLPCLISATISFIGVVLGYVFLEETLPSKQKRNNEQLRPSNAHEETYSKPGVPAAGKGCMRVQDLMALPAIHSLVTSAFALNFLYISFQVVFVLFCYSPVQSGGLAFSAEEIGYALTIGGAILIGIQLFITPYLLRTFDCATLYAFCMSMWPLAYFCLPFLNVIARLGLTEGGELSTSACAMLWTGIIIVLAISRVGILGYSVSTILVKEHSPNPASLSQVNGIVQFSMSLGSSLAPFMISSLFTTLIRNRILGGYLWAIIMVVVSTIISVNSRKILVHAKKCAT